MVVMKREALTDQSMFVAGAFAALAERRFCCPG